MVLLYYFFFFVLFSVYVHVCTCTLLLCVYLCIVNSLVLINSVTEALIHV